MNASRRVQLGLVQAAIVLVAAVVFLTGITWGLPSSATDKFLFGGRTPWTGKEIMELAGPWTATSSRGADVDANPVDRSKLAVLNDTDAKRAEIVRRYRLYSYQPDEMITFRALAQMKPSQGQFDPRLYQYGGLWIYPVGALLKLSSAMGFVTLTSDLTVYLDHPEAFGRFYVVARSYSAMWGIIGAVATFHLARRFTSSLCSAGATAGVFIFMPAAVNLAHEAKPHLPAAVLMLLAILAAFRYLRTGMLRDAILAGAGCGAAAGMVISAFPIFFMIPVMSALRARWSVMARRHLLVTGAALATGAGVYVLSNPYVVINFVRHNPALASNLANSAAMYHPAASSGALSTAAWLIFEGTSPLVAGAGLIAGIFLFRRIRGEVFLFVVPGVLILTQFVALAAGKPGEYARFALFPDIALGMLAMLGIGRLAPSRLARVAVCAIVLASQVYHAYEYVSGFRIDSGTNASRLISAAYIADMKSRGNRLLVEAEPAPYILPAVDLFHWQILLPPRGGKVAADTYSASVRTLQWHQTTPMSWANAYFVISENPAPPLTSSPGSQ